MKTAPMTLRNSASAARHAATHTANPLATYTAKSAARTMARTTARGALGVIMALGLAACSNVESEKTETKQIMQGMLKMVGLAPKAAPAPSDAQIAAAAMAEVQGPLRLLRFPLRDVAAAIYFVQGNRGVDTWASADQRGFYFRGGMLVATRGLGGDLMHADVAQSLSLVQARRQGAARRVMHYLTGDNQPDAQSFECRITRGAAQHTAYAAMSAQTVQMRESCTGGDRHFENLYWVTAQGRIVRSEQWQGDMAEMIKITDLRNW